MIVFAHPITEEGKGRYLENQISRLLSVGSKTDNDGLIVSRFKNGVAVNHKEYTFSWVDDQFRFWTASQKSLEHSFSEAVTALKSLIRREDEFLIAC